MPVQRIALQGIEQGDAFRQTEESQFLLATGAEIVRRWQDRNGGLAGRLEGVEFVEMLASADRISEPTRKAASEFLHGFLEKQLVARQKIDDPGNFDASTMWIVYTVQTLAAVDGELPNALLNQYKMEEGSAQAKAFDAWADAFRANSYDFDRTMSIWWVQFPLETIAVVLDAAGDTIRAQAVDRSMPAEVALARGRSAPQMRSLEQIGLVIAIPYAAQHREDEDVQLGLGAMLEMKVQRSLDELQLAVPLRAYANSLLEIARGNAVGPARGIALRLAQLGGADNTKVQQLALQWLAAKKVDGEQERWEVNSRELVWLLECLASAQPIELSDEQAKIVSDRVIAASFSPFARDGLGLEQCIIAALNLSRRGVAPDPRIVKAALGMRVADFRPNWSSARNGRPRQAPTMEDQRWRLVAGGVPIAVVQKALETLIEYPSADKEILSQLQSMQRRVAQTGDFANEPSKLLSEAFAAVQKAIADSPEK